MNAIDASAAQAVSNHAEHTVRVQAPVERVFAWLDDQARLAQHMSKRSWRMGWGKMEVQLDSKRGRAVGSHIVLQGRVFGIRLYLDEVVVEHAPPLRKTWKTVGEPRLLVIGSYRMGFDLEPTGATTKLRVSIDYLLPAKGMSRLFGLMFAAMYARWCVRQMAEDAHRAT
jgi:uncharacterized protein YndB with AHSA1/START domain